MDPFDQMIDQIYEAAVVPDMWPDVLANLVMRTGTLGSVLIARSDSGLKMIASTDEFLRDASEYFLTYSAHNERMLRLLGAAHHGFLSDFDVFTPSEIADQPMFRDFLVPRGYGRGIATVIPMPTGEQVILHCEGRYSDQPFDPVHVAFLDRLRPHLARAALLGARTAFLAARSAIDTLERLGLPAVALRAQGGVVVANALFEAEAPHWARGTQGQLSLIDPKADRLLADALRAVRHAHVVRSIPVSREDGPGVIHVIPIRRSAVDLFGQTAALAIFMRPRRQEPPATPLLQALFDLTPAEAAVAQDLAAGQTPALIAARRQTSVETVRNQVKRILSKTGCTRQAELQTLLAMLGAPGAGAG